MEDKILRSKTQCIKLKQNIYKTLKSIPNTKNSFSLSIERDRETKKIASLLSSKIVVKYLKN